MKKCLMSFAVLFFLNNDYAFCKIDSLADLHALAASQEDFRYQDYYQVKEDPRVAVVDLMNFEHVQSAFPLPTTTYNRKVQFGTWINYPGDNLCLNTRNKVLLREAKSIVTFTPDGCAVQSGQWDDPYTGTEISSTRDIQIDHFVPLKNVYMTGGFEWDQSKRCLYANYMGNSFHLLAVNGTQNMRKGDNTPAAYMPPNKGYSCQYLKQWLQVKVIWALRITPKEHAGIQKEFEDEGCDRAQFRMTAGELTEQRRFMDDNKDLCLRPPKNH